MDRKVSNIIKEWKDEAGVEGIVQVSAFSKIQSEITICTDRPGLMIGKAGTLLDKYEEKLKKVNPRLERVLFVETDSWYIK